MVDAVANEPNADPTATDAMAGTDSGTGGTQMGARELVMAYFKSQAMIDLSMKMQQELEGKEWEPGPTAVIRY